MYCKQESSLMINGAVSAVARMLEEALLFFLWPGVGWCFFLFFFLSPFFFPFARLQSVSEAGR